MPISIIKVIYNFHYSNTDIMWSLHQQQLVHTIYNLQRTVTDMAFNLAEGNSLLKKYSIRFYLLPSYPARTCLKSRIWLEHKFFLIILIRPSPTKLPCRRPLFAQFHVKWQSCSPLKIIISETSDLLHSKCSKSRIENTWKDGSFEFEKH